MNSWIIFSYRLITNELDKEKLEKDWLDIVVCTG